MTTQDFLTEETAEELLGMTDEQLDHLLNARVMALQKDPGLSLQPSFEPEPTPLEALTVPTWLQKTVEEMVNTAIRQTYHVVCSKDPDYKGIRDDLTCLLYTSPSPRD